MQQNKLNIEIKSVQILEGVPSASGIVKFKEDFYAIGDDSPYLFHIDKNFELVSKRLIYSSEKLSGHTIPKIDKPDFEAMEMISDTEMLIFGSGSKAPERDVCVWVEIKEDAIAHQSYNIGAFYTYLRHLEIMQGYELNIEAFTLLDDICYLFNRGRNVIFSFSLSEFLNFCNTEAPVPIAKTHLVSLPKINDLQAGFSGATTLENRSSLIFTATVEGTPNAYDDGEILGSFIGVIKLNATGIAQDFVVQPIPNPGFPLKVESVIIDKIISKSETDLVLVTDNDGAPSHIIRLCMTLKHC